MSCTTGTGDDGAQAALPSGGSVFEKTVGRAMSADDAGFVGNVERAQDFNGSREHLVVALRAHHHADKGLFAHGVIISGRQRRAAGDRAVYSSSTGTETLPLIDVWICTTAAVPSYFVLFRCSLPSKHKTSFSPRDFMCGLNRILRTAAANQTYLRCQVSTATSRT